MAISKRREREKAERRKDIIDAAEKLFFSNNYDNVSMNDIAEDVELSKATLYLYFDSKESLFFVIVLRGVKILNSMVHAAVDNVSTGIEKIMAYLTAYHEFMVDYPDYLRIYNYFHSGRFNLREIINKQYLNDFVEQVGYSTVAPGAFPVSSDISQGMHSEFATEIIQRSQKLFEILKLSIEIGIADESIRSDVNSVEAAALLTLFIDSMIKIRPDILKSLEFYGINQSKFNEDSEEFIKRMLTN
ncbi:TetR/AcrR family transcriptional regulator [Methanobacterium alcaliphilum]|uniref:TetR/AcrR family transcriptional regulator n=1 Tax=Methanobacterium alcaliphilum TaxID=392018 RepID=UPI00200B37F8|nr:TetR/AcrR family transcriptional regulator [Methanobacterium alcaliphilum]MCK9150834.1 TetR/AcrR family transcriptional regulator [Methanobacterium alcaliphilum]